MDRNGLYECLECEYRVYNTEDKALIDVCRQCGSDMKKISVPSKGWLLG
jgi:Zn finger protein HypA/HybF involved in hydrogenase expression